MDKWSDIQKIDDSIKFNEKLSKQKDHISEVVKLKNELIYRFDNEINHLHKIYSEVSDKQVDLRLTKKNCRSQFTVKKNIGNDFFFLLL